MLLRETGSVHSILIEIVEINDAGGLAVENVVRSVDLKIWWRIFVVVVVVVVALVVVVGGVLQWPKFDQRNSSRFCLNSLRFCWNLYVGTSIFKNQN